MTYEKDITGDVVAQEHWCSSGFAAAVVFTDEVVQSVSTVGT
jgi:hypothetical protein